MICHRCGAEIPDNSIRCSNCGIKVNMYCPACKTLNSFGSKTCKNCGYELLIECPVCNSINIYSATECRKCHSPLTKVATNPIELKETKKEAVSQVVEAFSSQNTTFVENEVVTKEEEKTQDIQTLSESELANLPDIEDIQKVDENQQEEKIFNVDSIFDEIPSVEENTATPEDETIDALLTQDVEMVQEVPTDELIADEPIETLPEILDENVEKSLNESEEVSELDTVETKEEEFKYNFKIQSEATNKVVNLIKNSLMKNIIAINGPEGSGKTAILKQTKDEISQKGFVTLYGSCTPLVQITSFGFFQDAFLRMLGFPPYTNSKETFIKDFTQSKYSKLFSRLSGAELTSFLNIFYPSQKDNFENILENKKIMFNILEKVIKSFLINNNMVIIINNFELLDGASYDFLMYLLNKGSFNSRLKLLVAYQENKSIQSYFDLTNIDEEIFETIVVKKFEKDEMLHLIEQATSIQLKDILPKQYLDSLLEKTDGNATKMEQAVAFLFNIGYISLQGNDIVINEERKQHANPASFEDLIKLRIHALNPGARTVLYLASIMGYRFAANILKAAVTMPVKMAEQMLDYLSQELFIEKIDDYTYEFKSLSLWKLIYKEAKADVLYKDNSERLYLSLKSLILSSNLQKVISCAEALTKNEAFLIWQNTAHIAAKLGDTNLYIISQKQCLKILEEQESSDSDVIKSQIYEEIGKLLCEKSPKEAITYLSNVLDTEIKASNARKVIDISGYFIKSCYLTGNYFGVTEAIDTILKELDRIKTNVSSLDIALINTRKLRALLGIGNSEQIINIVNQEIMPEIEKGLTQNSIDPSYKTMIINAWLLSKVTLAKAYIQQGDNVAVSIISEIRQFVDKYKYNTEYYKTQADILEAFTNTVTGDINQSNEILNKVSAKYSNKNLQTTLLAEWNLLNIINRLLLGQIKDLKADLFEFAAFANNINQHFIKNVIKLILGYVLKEEGNNEKALEIYNDEITYFAKEKVAIGAMLAWAFIIRLYISTQEYDKALDMATKSLDIAQSPKINNYFFIIYFQKFLSEVYLKKEDFTASKMYLEKSIMLAKQFNMNYQLIDLYIEYAKYTEALMKHKRIFSTENVNLTLELYEKAVKTAKDLHLANLIDKSVQERSAFKTYCQLNSIEI
jgi:hypothetical protein